MHNILMQTYYGASGEAARLMVHQRFALGAKFVLMGPDHVAMRLEQRQTTTNELRGGIFLLKKLVRSDALETILEGRMQ